VTPVGLVPQPATPRVFSIGASGADQGAALARFAAEELKAGRAAVLADGRSPLFANLAAAFRENFRKLIGKPADERTYHSPDELAELARQLVTREPAAVVLAGAPADLARLVRELQQAKLPARVPLLLGGEEPAGPGPEPAAGQPLYRATAYAPGESPPQLAAFVQRYTEKFGRPPDVHAVLAHDGVRLLCKALHRAGSAQGGKVRDELARCKTFESLTGPLTFATDHTARRPVYVVRIEDGQPGSAKRYDAKAE
jgi:branched-chain amino acid transport system substrate-binding protein